MRATSAARPYYPNALPRRVMPEPGAAGDLMARVERPPFTAARAGYPITFKRFLSAGLPSVLVMVALGCAWLFNHFF
jgi:hypothetical protein